MLRTRRASSGCWLKTTKAGSGNFNEGLGLLYGAETKVQVKKKVEKREREKEREERKEKTSTNSCLPLKLPLLLARGEDFTKFCSWYRNNGDAQ